MKRFICEVNQISDMGSIKALRVIQIMDPKAMVALRPTLRTLKNKETCLPNFMKL